MQTFIFSFLKKQLKKICFRKDDGRKVNKATKISAQFSAIQQSKKKLNEGRRRLFLFGSGGGKKRGAEEEEEEEEEKKAFHFLSGGKEKRGLLGCTETTILYEKRTKISFLVEIIEAPV
jgi:hypothetical protein